jgi:hypothetical protein
LSITSTLERLEKGLKDFKQINQAIKQAGMTRND